MSKELRKRLPKNRPYSDVEAAFSIQVDHDCGNAVTVAGYAELWQWSRHKVTDFLSEMGVSILRPEDTQKRRNQKGHIAGHKTDISTPKKGHIRFIDSKDIDDKKDISPRKKGHKTDISKDTTINPIDPNTPLTPQGAEEIYAIYRAEIASEHNTKGRAIENITHALKKYEPADLLRTITNYKRQCEKKKTLPKYRKDAANFFGRGKTPEFGEHLHPEDLEPEEPKPEYDEFPEFSPWIAPVICEGNEDEICS